MNDTGLLAHLLGDASGAPPQCDGVARDLEDLLNTRCALPQQSLRAYPECMRSIVNYGLSDFCGMSGNGEDEGSGIGAAIRTAIMRHEPRLNNVRTALVPRPGTVNKVSFAISATLRDRPDDPICFDALLQPSSLQYSIKRYGGGGGK